MSNNPQPGQIISVEDLMDTFVYYMMPPVPQYQDKITLVFNDGVRFSVLRDQIMGTNTFGGWQAVAGSLRVGDTIPAQYLGDSWSGKRRPSDIPKSKARTITQIIDPADNTTFSGIDKHTFEAKMPIPGELISIPDITNFFITSGETMYQYKYVYVYEWTNDNYSNERDVWSRWDNPGGPGWIIVRQWQLQQLITPVTSEGGLYEKIPEDKKLKEDQLISIYNLKWILSQMYNVNNNLGSSSSHHLTCHSNCHHACHCKRW